MANTIIDRRKNGDLRQPGSKSSNNRQKFIKRTKKEIRKSIHDTLGKRSIKGSGDAQDVVINRKGIDEPQFSHNPQTGSRDIVLPGNKEYVEGDLLQKPKGGAGSGGASGKASNEGIGEDEFGFALSNDEFVNILFEDLELPHMISKENKAVQRYEISRSGYTTDGTPAQMNLEKSMVNSLGRKIALKTPKLKKIKELQEELDNLDKFFYKTTKEQKEATEEWKRYQEIEEEIRKLRIRANAVSFVDPVDLRYNNFTKKPAPISQAVVFFIMDVSASMTEQHKDLAKRFFMLLNLFVSRKYKRVECVFIRHHILAMESSEDEFFNSRDNGGTIVSSAFKLSKEILADRYSPNEWNIYFAQASDGDNFDNDNEELKDIIANDILPITQYFSYIQVGIKRHGYYNSGNLLQEYVPLQAQHKNMVTKHIEDTSDIYPVFREIFKIRGKNE
ncbi:uncharacterized protein METZ01_LOCUS102274 [marine metagenome]|uniref:Uncharacterized protein n=1 Tax=marine metagenome TaxID=408172 RepID=A0A381WA51_9ZZZZ